MPSRRATGSPFAANRSQAPTHSTANHHFIETRATHPTRAWGPWLGSTLPRNVSARTATLTTDLTPGLRQPTRALVPARNGVGIHRARFSDTAIGRRRATRLGPAGSFRSKLCPFRDPGTPPARLNIPELVESPVATSQAAEIIRAFGAPTILT